MIWRLERFLADWERKSGITYTDKAAPTGKRVAKVGTGSRAQGDCCSRSSEALSRSSDFLRLCIIQAECLCTGYPSFDCQWQLFRQKLSTSRNLELTSALISLWEGLSRFRNYSNQALTLFSSQQVQGCTSFGNPWRELGWKILC